MAPIPQSQPLHSGVQESPDHGPLFPQGWLTGSCLTQGGCGLICDQGYEKFTNCLNRGLGWKRELQRGPDLVWS